MSKEIFIKFKLKLNIDKWGSYKKGDESTFVIPVKSQGNGLSRYPIDKHWDIVSCEFLDEDREAEKKELLDCIHNFMGHFDTPIARMKMKSDTIEEVRQIGRDIMKKYERDYRGV